MTPVYVLTINCVISTKLFSEGRLDSQVGCIFPSDNRLPDLTLPVSVISQAQATQANKPQPGAWRVEGNVTLEFV